MLKSYLSTVLNIIYYKEADIEHKIEQRAATVRYGEISKVDASIGGTYKESFCQLIIKAPLRGTIDYDLYISLVLFVSK